VRQFCEDAGEDTARRQDDGKQRERDGGTAGGRRVSGGGVVGNRRARRLGLQGLILRSGAMHGSRPIELLATWHRWDSCRTGKKKTSGGVGGLRWAEGSGWASFLLLFFF
jgi:hypothetical protein